MSLDQPRNHPKNKGGFNNRHRIDGDKPLTSGPDPVDEALAAVHRRWPRVEYAIVTASDDDRWTWPPGSNLSAPATVTEVILWKEVDAPSGVFVLESGWERGGYAPVPAELQDLDRALADVRDLSVYDLENGVASEDDDDVKFWFKLAEPGGDVPRGAVWSPRT